MANLPSAKKRIKQSERSRIRNRARKSVVKTVTRKFLDAVHRGDVKQAEELYVSVTKTLDQTAAKGTLHRKTVSRRKSRLAQRLNALKAAPAS